MMREAKARGAELVVFTELALTTFFPRWLIEDEAELDSYYEREMPGPETQPLFDEAKKLGVGFYLGYRRAVRRKAAGSAGSTPRSWSTARAASSASTARCICRGHAEPQPNRAHQHLEKRYFEPGNLGFPVWRAFGGVMGMCICNDRRWPETYRVMGLQGVEMVMLGYNTPVSTTPATSDIDGLTSSTTTCPCRPAPTRMRPGSSARPSAACEEGSNMVGQSVIIAPSGEIVAQAVSLEDEVITARCDLDLRQALPRDDLQFRHAPRAGSLPADRRAQGRHSAA